MKPLTGSKNQCGSCKQMFNSNTPFTLHRIGKFRVDRRCMTTEEMLAAGMSLNKAGFWVSEKMPERLKEHYEHNDA